VIYPKNVPNFERIIRIAIAILLIGAAFISTPVLGAPTPLRTILLIGSALFLVVTGFVGWCPMCALVGRKLKK